MKRTTILALTLLAALLLASGATAAKNLVVCQDFSNPCEGTEQADDIEGTNGANEVIARGGNDAIFVGGGVGGDDGV